MGCPCGITDKKYDRNTLIFNFAFVFDKNCDTAPFESVVRKLGETFKIYEVKIIYILHLLAKIFCHNCVISWKMVFFRTTTGGVGYQRY